MGLIRKQMGATPPKEQVEAWLRTKPAESIYLGKYTQYNDDFKILVEREPGLILQNLAYHNTNGELIEWLVFDFSIHKTVEFKFYPMFEPGFARYNMVTPLDWRTHLSRLDKYLCGLDRVYVSYNSNTFPRLNTMCFERLGPNLWDINKELSVNWDKT